MALTYSHSANAPRIARLAGGAYAWFGFVVMWAFWISFVVFLANPRWAAKQWHLPTIDGTSDAVHPAIAAAIDLALISLFGLQHSVMARPWFKSAVMGRLPDAFQRCTYVHAANMALFALIVFWQPVPVVVYAAGTHLRELFWAAFGAGWIILFLGALSFGIRDLLGIRQMQARELGRRRRDSRPACSIDGCAIPCMSACCSLCGPRLA